MEDLLLRGIRWSTDLAGIHDLGHVFDVVQNDICWLAFDLVVLPAADWSNMSGDTGVDDHIVFSGVLCHGQGS